MSILGKVYKAAGWYWGGYSPPLGRAVTALHPQCFCAF